MSAEVPFPLGDNSAGLDLPDPSEVNNPGTLREQINKLLEHSGDSDVFQDRKLRRRDALLAIFAARRIIHEDAELKADLELESLYQEYLLLQAIRNRFAHRSCLDLAEIVADPRHIISEPNTQPGLLSRRKLLEKLLGGLFRG